MKIREVMTPEAQLISADDTLQRAAQMMKECDCGILPVAQGDRLIGMITDRDMAVRGLALGKGADCKVREAMSEEVKYCFEDEDCEHVIQNMADLQVRRLPVMNRSKRLVGIVSLADLTREDPGASKALHGIVRPGGEHNQTRAA